MIIAIALPLKSSAVKSTAQFYRHKLIALTRLKQLFEAEIYKDQITNGQDDG